MQKTLILAALLLPVSLVSAQNAPLPPRIAPQRMTLPDGFKVTLFAGEPDVVQPIAMCFDARGRLWVAECYSYPHWHKDLTQGKDRILIFEDTKGAGVFDKRTVFADKLANVSGLQVGYGGVFVLATPNVLFIPDKNGDDVPDGPPEILLDGFDIKAGHNVMSCLTWGPDGWLYGCHGIQANPKIGKPGTPPEQRAHLNCGVWRYHPVTRAVEAVAHGTTNPWGLDFDEYGEMFITNCVIGHLWHVVPGAHFERMYGQDINPYSYGLLKMCADHIHWGGGSWTSSRGGTGAHSVAGGGHAHVGCMVYLADNFPQSYRDTVFMCNLHGNRINNDILERKGSSYVARHGKDFLFANDTWFRGISILYGPDGAVYVSDWTDTGECHNYQTVDQTNGRIYKVSYGQPKNPAEKFGKNWDLNKLSDEELVKLQLHPNDYYVRTARYLLQGRAASGKLDQERALDLILEMYHRQRNDKNVTTKVRVRGQLRLLWAGHVTGVLDGAFLVKVAADPDENLRSWAIRLIMEKKETAVRCLTLLELVAAEDTSPLVRLTLASALQRLPVKDRYPIARKLVCGHDDSDDPYLPLMLWYGMEPLAQEYPEEAADLMANSRIPLIREYFARRRASINDKAMGQVVATLSDKDAPAFQRDVLLGVQEALKGRRKVPMPFSWTKTLPILLQNPLPEVQEIAINLAVQFGDARAFARLEKILVNSKEMTARRQAALDTLLFQQQATLLPLLQNLLDEAGMRDAAIKGLARFDDPRTPALLLKHYGGLTAAEKADAIHTLTARPSFAQELVSALEKKQIPLSDVSAFNARQILALGNSALTSRFTHVWGAIRPASQAKAALLIKYKTALTMEKLKNANLAKGRLVYQKTCAACHRLFDEGGNIGPELTGSQRANLDYILENILDPSAIVAKDYQVTILNTASGRVITGIVKRETDKSVEVQTQNELILLPKEDIESRQPSPMSMMPEGQLDPMSMDEVRDLIAYLSSPVQVPLPAQRKEKVR